MTNHTEEKRKLEARKSNQELNALRNACRSFEGCEEAAIRFTRERKEKEGKKVNSSPSRSDYHDALLFHSSMDREQIDTFRNEARRGIYARN